MGNDAMWEWPKLGESFKSLSQLEILSLYILHGAMWLWLTLNILKVVWECHPRPMSILEACPFLFSYWHMPFPFINVEIHIPLFMKELLRIPIWLILWFFWLQFSHPEAFSAQVDTYQMPSSISILAALSFHFLL